MTKPDDEGHAATKTTHDTGVQDKQVDTSSALQKLRIGQALFATTWRIVIPVLIFSGLGISLDLRFGSKPWLTLVGVVIGFSMAGVLIARLIKESEKL